MQSNSGSEEKFDIVEVLLFLWKGKWPLLITGILGGVLALVFSLMMDPEYESYTILYPTSNTSIEKLLEDPQFGYDIHAERLVQTLESDAIRDSLVEKFNLVEHYEVDKSNPAWQHELSLKYHEKVRVQKTIYASVVIRVQDVDPQKAADIANEMARLVDVVRWDIVKATAAQALKVVEKDYEAKSLYINSLQDSILMYQTKHQGSRLQEQKMRVDRQKERVNRILDQLQETDSGSYVYDVSEQMLLLQEKLDLQQAVINREEDWLSARAGNSPPDSTTRIRNRLKTAEERANKLLTEMESLQKRSVEISNLEKRLEIEQELLSKYQGDYQYLLLNNDLLATDPILQRLTDTYRFHSGLLNELQIKYQQALTRYQEPIPATYRVTEAQPSYKKVSPNTLLNLALGIIFPVLLMIALLLFRGKWNEFLRRIKEEK